MRGIVAHGVLRMGRVKPYLSKWLLLISNLTRILEGRVLTCILVDLHFEVGWCEL